MNRLARADIVIVGAGHGGAQAAIALRQNNYEGTIAIIGDEPHLPYERPPLSKEYLSGEQAFERILIRPPSFWEDHGVTMWLGRQVTAVDPDAHLLTLDAVDSLAYGRLIWAAGGSPRQLSCAGHDLAGVHTVRTRADVDRISRELDFADRVIVVGGGYIGLEAAAILSKLGKKVIVLEALDRVLGRVAGEPLSRFFEGKHAAHGVNIRLNAEVDCIEGRGGRVTGVRLADGEVLDCEMVIVGIGIVPAVAPLIAAGAEGDNGVAVDLTCRTSLPDVFAIGDCALHPNAFANGAMVRLESVQNANDQAAVVAKAVTGARVTYDAVPWFWSDQYDVRLQTVGLSIGHDEHVLRGDPDTGGFSIIYLREGRIIALDCVNATRDYIQGRALVFSGARIAPDQLADATKALKEIAAAA